MDPPRRYPLEHEGGRHEQYSNEERSKQPNEELVAFKEVEQLVQVVRRFCYGAKGANENRSGSDEQGADEGVSGEGFAEDDGCAYSIEYEARLGALVVS
jgi:hypothetical protein